MYKSFNFFRFIAENAHWGKQERQITGTRKGFLLFTAFIFILVINTCKLFEPGTGDKVDVTPPVLTISSPAQNTYVRGVFTVNGKASDDLSLKSVIVSYPGTSGNVTQAITPVNGAWSLDIPTGTALSDNLIEGRQTISVTATDSSNKATEAFVMVIVDNVAPTVLVSVPQGYGASQSIAADYIDIKGEVWDPSPIQEVKIHLVNVAGTSQLCDGTYTWSTRVELTALPNLTTFDYMVEATDKAGNKNTYYYHSQNIWALLPPDTRFPSMDDIGTLDQTKSGTAGGITYANFFSGRLGTDTALYGDFYKNNDATLPEIHFTNLDPALAITANVIGSKVPINGYANPGPANAPVEQTTFKAWIIPSSAYPTWPASPNVLSGDITTAFIGSSISYQIKTRINGTDIGSGQYYAKVSVGAQGTAGVSTIVCGFLVDDGAPRIESVLPANNSLITRKVFSAGTPLAGQTGIEILVKAIDDNAVQSISAVAALTDGGAALPGLAYADDTSQGQPDWYIIQVPLGAGNEDIWFEIEAVDDTGALTHVTLHYNIDETIPALTIESPAVNAWVTGNSTTVTGTSSDNTGLVKTIYVWLGPAADIPPALSTWTALPGNAAWATTLPLLSGEGEYAVHAYALDFADNLSSEACTNFFLDQSNPTLTETSIGTVTAYKIAPFTLSGIAGDSNALDHMTVTQVLDGGAPATVLEQALSGLTYNWSWTLPVAAPEGIYEYAINLTDAAGKTAFPVNRTIVYDKTAPTVDIISVTPLVGVNAVNGIITYAAYAVDMNGIGSVRRWILPSAASDPVWSTAGYTVWDSPYSTTLDTTVGLTDGQEYKIWVMAMDNAGNTSSVSRTITADQSSDAPALILSNLDESKNTPALGWDNLLESNPKIQGNITDDDMVNAASIEISINSTSAWTPVTQKGPNGRTVSFEHNLTIPSELPEGVHYFYIRCADLASAKAGLPAVNTTLGPVYFVIDKNPPAIAVAAPSQDTIQSLDFTITGSASDANGLADLDTDTLADIEVSTNGGTVWSVVPADGGSWSYAVSIDPGHSYDGVHTYKFRATDYFGKTTVLDFRFNADTLGPTLALSAAPPSSWLSGSTFLAGGTASDGTGSGVNTVYWWAGASADVPPADTGSWNVATGKTFWSALMDLSTLGEGEKRFHVKAADMIGNFSSVVTWDFGIDQTNPVLVISNVGTGVVGRNALFNMAGTADDTNSLAGLLVEQKKNTDPFVTIANPVLTGTSDVWDITGLPRDPSSPLDALMADGLFEYRVTLTDAAGRVHQLTRTVRIDTTPPDVVIINPGADAWLSGSAFTASGTATDALTGVAMVEWSINGTDWYGAAGTVSWSTTLDLAATGEGAKTFYVRAADSAGNVSTPETQSFGIDQNLPELAETGINQAAVYRSANYTLSGTASDTNALLSNAGVPYITLTINGMASSNINVAAGTWSYAVTVDTAGHTDDGEYEYVLTAADIAGKTRQVTRMVTVDTAPPSAEITAVSPLIGTDTVNGIISYGASASDASGLTGVRCWMLPGTDPDPLWATPGYINAWTAPPYSGTIDTTTLTDGQVYKLWIAARDKAGNETIISQAVSVNQSSDNPVPSLTNMDAAKDTAPEAQDNLQETNARVKGAVTDDDKVDSTTIMISIDGGAYNAVSQHGPNATSVSFEHDVSALAEGVHYFSVRAYDLASAKSGKPAVSGTLGPVYFTIDRNPPALAAVSPAQDSTLNADFTISGTASDANALKDLDSDTLADIEVSINGGVDWTVIPANGGTWSYDVPVDAGHTFDGAHTYKFRATDAFNKTTVMDYRFIIDTQAPVTAVAAPSSGSWLGSASYTVSGTAVDNTGGAGVAEIWSLVDAAVVDHSADTTVEITTGGAWKKATGTATWSYGWNLGTEGLKKLWVAALDFAGNWSSSYLSVAFGLDTANPVLAETGVNTPNIVYRNNTIAFSGTAADSNPAASPSLAVSVDGSASQAVIITAGSWNYNYTVNTGTHAQDGTHSFVFTLTDAAGKTQVLNRSVLVDTQTIAPSIATPAAASWVSTALYSVTGNAGDNSGGSGVKEIWTLVDDAAVEHGTDTTIAITTGGVWQLASGTASWNYIWDLGAEGNKKLWVALQDNAGNWTTTYQTVAFGLDTGNPSLAETTVGTSGIVSRNATISFAGTATDSNPAAVPSLRVSIDGGLAESVTVTAGTWSYNYTVNAGTHAQDGSHNYVFTLTDAAGKTTTVNRSIVVDTITPSVQINSVLPILAGNQVNGVVTLSSNVSDNNGLNGVKYFLRNNGSTPVYADGDGILIPSAPYSANIDTTARTDGAWTLWVIAIDKADNTQSTSAVIDVLQATDYPSAAIDSPGDTEAIGVDKKIRGTFSDDDGVAVTGAVLYVRKQGAPSYTSKPIGIASNANQLVAWSVSVADVILAGGDGTYEMYLAVTDDAARKSGKSAVTQNTAGQTFTSDANPPTVSTISITPVQAAYKAGDVLTLSWTASDLLGLAAQTADVDSSTTGLGTITNPSGDNFQVTYTVPGSGIASGNKTFTLVVEDNTAHTTSKTVTFLVDIDDPVVDNAFTVYPSFIGSTPNGEFALKGTASDNRGLGSVQLQLSGPNGNDGTNWYAAALVSGNWTYNVVNSAFYAAASGTLTFKVRAVDQAGNISAEREFTQAVDQAADKPVVTVISPVDLSTYGTTVQISGTAVDDDNLADIDNDLLIDADAIEIQYWDTDTPGSPVTLYPSITGSGRNANFNSSVSGLDSGDFIVRVRAKDDASTWGDWSPETTFTVNAGAPNMTVLTAVDTFRSNPSLTLNGTVTDGQGVKYVRVRINGAAWQTANAGSGAWGVTNTSDTWSINLSLGSDGLKTIEIQASDMGDFITNQQISTTLDSTPPAGTFDVQFRDNPTGSFLNTDALNKIVRITGTVTELNLTDTNPVELSINGGAYVAVTGTFVWSYVWDTTALTDGDYDLALRITDKAGNITTSVTKTVSINQSLDTPGITSSLVAAPDSASAGNNVLGTLLKVSGTISDDDGFNAGAVGIFLDGNATPVTASNTTGTTGSWEYTWVSLAQGEHYLTLQATDRNGAVYNTGVTYFIVDTANPTLILSTPTAGSKVKAGTLSITGTVTDAGGLDASPLAIVLRHSNETSTLHNAGYAPVVSGGAWSQTVTIDDLVLDGTLYIDLTLTDRAGKQSSLTRAVTIDITPPTLNLNYPAAAAYINGLVSLTGTADDLNGLANVTLEILNPVTKNPVANITRSSSTMAAWEFPFNSFAYTTTTYGVDVNADGKLWQIFFRLLAQDNSGNTTELKVGSPPDWPYFYIDTDGDKPTISVTQPKNGDKIGGIVGMFGSATDDDGPVMQVEVRIDFNGNDNFIDTRDINNNDLDGNPATGIEPGVDTNIFGNIVKIGDGAHMWEDESAWYVVPVTNNGWTLELNSDGELYMSNTGGTGDIIIQVRSRDMFGLASEISERTITLDETFPRIENVLPIDQTYQSGTFNLNVEFADNIDLDLGSNSQIRINLGKTGYQTLSEGVYTAGTHPYTLNADLAEPQNGFDLSYPVNTNTYFPGASGILYADLYVKDESSYVNQRSFTYYVDNQAPTTTWSDSITRPDGANLRNGMISVNGVNKTYIEGNYADSGAVSGISHIEVYFVKSGNVRNLKSTAAWGGTPATESITAETYNLGTNTWSTGTSGAAPFIDHATLGDNYVIKIDKPTEMSDLNFGTDIDGDGYHEFLGIYDGKARWRAYFNSQYLPDGILDLHYVAYDLAGNREHRMRQVFIANNGPVIDRIQVGSDLNYSGTVADVTGGVTEIQDYYYPGGAVNRSDSQKIKNNKLYFGIYGDDPSGTNMGVKQIFIDVYNSTGLTYHGQAYASGLNPSDGDAVITLNANPGTAPWVDDGNYTVAPYKVDYQVKITVRDNDDINLTHWVKVSVLNPDDSIPPVITLNALAQADQDGSSGHLELAGDNTAGAWNTIKAAYDNDDDPKASGTIIFKGTVTDETRLTEISVASENNPLPVLATWSGGILVSNDAAVFLINSQQLTETGHIVTFTYKWNSANVTGIAGMNKTVSFGAKDGATTPNNATPQARQLDVVPYIKSISRQFPMPTNRSKYGNFLVTSGETNIEVTGFNLGSAAYLPTVTINRTDGTVQNTVGVTGSGTPYSTLSFTGAQMVNSGYLKVTVNTRPSINNLNANTLTSNKEDDGSGYGTTLWNDDRYMLVFDVGDYFAGSDAPEWPSMSVNYTTGSIYGAWSSYNTARSYYARANSFGGGATQINDNVYDPAEYTDILMYDDAADIRHTVVLENENGNGAWQGLRSKIDDASGITVEYLGGDAGTDTNTNTINHSDGKDEMLFQFKNPRIAVNPAGAGTNNDVKYISYYDAWSKSLKYAVVTGGTGTFIPFSAHQTDNQTVVDGYDFLAGTAPDYKYAASENVGLWNDIGLDPDDGVPVIVYYSVTNKTLKIARGQNTQPVGNFNGTAPYAPSATHQWNIGNAWSPNSYLGSYVSMTIDRNPSSTTYGDLFIITFQNATGDLVFLHGQDVDGTGTGVNYTFDTPVTIDSAGSVGAWGDIALMYNGTTAVPYVSYLNSSAVGTLEGLKCAWVRSGTGSSSSDWENGIIPVNDPVRDHRTNIAAHATVNIGRNGGQNADVAIGFAGTYFNLVYRAKEQ